MTSNVHPLFEQIIKPFVSPPLERPLRSQAEVLAERTKALLTGPIWTIWVIPTADEPYTLEMSATEATNERSCLNALIDRLFHNFTALVIHTDAEGKRHDVSAQFAAQWIIHMARAGFDAETIQRNRFIGAHFCPWEIDELCK